MLTCILPCACSVTVLCSRSNRIYVACPNNANMPLVLWLPSDWSIFSVPMLRIQLSGICLTNSCPREYAQDTTFQLYTMQYSPTWYPGSWTITFVHYINTCQHNTRLLDILVVELLRLYTTSILVHTKMLRIQLSGICLTNSCPHEYAQDTTFQLYTMQYSSIWYPGNYYVCTLHQYMSTQY